MQSRTASPRLLAVALCTGLGLSALAAPSVAQTIGYNVRTGDVWVDHRLEEINRYGHDYRDPFIGEMTGHYGAPRSLIVDLLDRRGWAPADVYYACAIASAAGLPCIDVVNRYDPYDRDDRNRGRGWGVLAQELGIKPGSPQFHALKRGTVDTYDRWGYPITIDRDVRVDWSQPRDRGPRHESHGDRGGPPAHAGRGTARPDVGGGPGNGKPAHAGGPGRGNDKGGPPSGKGPGDDKGKGKSNGNGNGKGNGRG